MMAALDTAWVGVIGTAVGGVAGFVGSYLVHRGERSERRGGRSRTERKDGYSALLTAAEDSVHRFQWLAEGNFTSAGSAADRSAANFLYDQEVTPRYMVLRLVGGPDVATPAQQLCQAVNALHHLVTDKEALPTADEQDFRNAHNEYRAARDRFIRAAQEDLARSNG